MRRKVVTIITLAVVLAALVPVVYFGFPYLFADSIYPPIPEEAAAAINDCANLFGLDKSLLSAMILKESGFNQRAVSRAGAMGYTQLMPQTYRGLMSRVEELQGLPDDPFDTKTNICAGTAHLAGLLGTYGGDETAALIAYNGGDAAAQRYLASQSTSGLVAETRAYAPRILAARGFYQEVFKGGGGEVQSKPSNMEVKKPSDITKAFWKAFINDFFKSVVS